MIKNWTYIIFMFQLFVLFRHDGLTQINQTNKGLNYQIGFGQNLNSYRWQTSFHFVHLFPFRGLLSVEENFNSSLIRMGRFNDKWRDDQKLKIGLRYPMNINWGLQLLTQSNQFNDRISGLVSDIRTNYAMGGIYFSLPSNIKLASLAGYKFDRRLSKSDDGLTYRVEFAADSVNWSGYYNHFYLLADEDRYDERKNNNFDVVYRVKKIFQNDTYDSLAVYFSKQRRDNYDEFAPIGLYLESLSENTRGVKNILAYAVSSRVRLRIFSDLQLRNSQVSKKYKGDVLDQRSKDEFHSKNEIAVEINHKKIDSNISLAYVSASQKNEIPDSVLASKFSKYFYYISPDYQSARLVLSLRNRFKFSESDTLVLKAEVNKFQYDTPETNMDDRDELRMNFQFEYLHHFGDKLKIWLNGSTNLYHLVYIFSERSANNNWMRIFRLFPRVEYQPSPNFRIVQKSEVLANYVNYDFESASSLFEVRSYVFRRFMIEHNIDWQLYRDLGISVDYKFEIEENGKFRWEQWTEILMTTRNNHWLRANFVYKPSPYFSLAPGVIYFRRDVDSGNIVFSGSYLSSGRRGFISYGPSLSLRYNPGERIFFSVEAMRRAVENFGGEKQFINFVNLKLNWIY